MRPIWFLPFSVNQRAPSGPTTMSWGVELAVGGGNSVTTPVGVMRPILPVTSANHRFPSGPSVTPCGNAMLPIGYSLSICGGGIPPMTSSPSWSLLNSVNQRSLFGPGVMP